MWQNESRDTREAYKKLAEDEKERHIQLYPNYRYQPRKPSEKKRRMTKKKADAIIAKQDINTDDNDSEAPGGYYGDLTEVRTVTFPLSAGAQLCLLDDNATASTRETQKMAEDLILHHPRSMPTLRRLISRLWECTWVPSSVIRILFYPIPTDLVALLMALRLA